MMPTTDAPVRVRSARSAMLWPSIALPGATSTQAKSNSWSGGAELHELLVVAVVAEQRRVHLLAQLRADPVHLGDAVVHVQQRLPHHLEARLEFRLDDLGKATRLQVPQLLGTLGARDDAHPSG